MKLLTKEQWEWYENVKIYYVCKEKFENTYVKDKKYCKVREHCHYTEEYRGAAHSIWNLKYIVPKKSPAVFRNGSSYDYYFIIKEFAEELEKQFSCLGENTEKYITFTFLIKRRYKNCKKWRGNYQKLYLTYYNLLTVQGLSSAQYQILSIFFLLKNVKLAETCYISIATVFLNTQTLKMV